MDLNLFDYMKPGNYSDFSCPCNSSDSILVDMVQFPFMPHKSILLYTLSFIYIFIFMISMITNTVGVWVNIQAKTMSYDTHCYILNLAIMDLWVILTIQKFINQSYEYMLMKTFAFKYSAKMDISKVIDTSIVSETECLVLEQNTK
ncbi:Atypical chemokine receptor 3 [Sciurus carolinensis]|uniref:Atypical chemokine receptor 3 n=1 Tax=Sciurus carolinensis TaxID=30640 RepID=A0AA41N9Z4_SCICA|nr:Atypical chemokine receptor 3 [Sciurus carolinensis]